MKKYTAIFILVCIQMHQLFSQDLISKVPVSASMVIKYSGENFSRLMPLKKIDSYNFIRTKFFKLLKIDSLTSIENTGINFEKDAFQYVSLDDSSMNFVSLFYLKNLPDFLKLIKANYYTTILPVKKNGYEFITISQNTFLGWNNETAIFVVSNYQNRQSYFDYSLMDTTTTVAVDSAVEVTQEPPTDMDSTDTTIMVDPKILSADSIRQAKMDAWKLQRDSVTSMVQKKIADSIINASFNTSFPSIETDVSFKKVIDPAANIALWLNNDILISQYWTSFYSSLSNPYQHPDINYSIPTTKDGLRSGLNLFFDKDKIRMESKTFTSDEKMDKLSKSVYKNKQNMELTKFINPDNIGFVSMSINTEAMQHYYYKLLKQYLSNYSLTKGYADLVDVYIDFLEILVDEKGLSELSPGNYLFVLHDLKTVDVTYTDYTFDENFKSKQVIKTKKELSPNFTFIMDTKRDDFMKRLVALPVKYSKKGGLNYHEKGGYYELVFDSGAHNIQQIYFMVKDGKCIVTTSKESIDIALNNTNPYTLDKETKNSIKHNNYSLKLNTKKLLQEIYPEISTDVNKKINTYCQENIGDLKMESGLKHNLIQGTSTLDFTGNHSNGLEFIFDLIEGINNIILQEKLESKKLND